MTKKKKKSDRTANLQPMEREMCRWDEPHRLAQSKLAESLRKPERKARQQESEKEN